MGVLSSIFRMVVNGLYYLNLPRRPVGLGMNVFVDITLLLGGNGVPVAANLAASPICPLGPSELNLPLILLQSS